MAGHWKKTLTGYTQMLVFVIMMAASVVGVQCLQRAVPDFQLGTYRYIGGTLLALIPVCFSRMDVKIPQHLWAPMLGLVFTSTVNNLLFYFAVSVLPLSHASSLTYILQTIVMAGISIVLLHEKGSLLLYTSVFGCMVGILFELQPWLSFDAGFTTGFAEVTHELNFIPTSNHTLVSANKGVLLMGYIACVLAGVSEAFAVFFVSKYLRELHPATLLLYISSISVILQILCCLYLEQPVIVTDPYAMLLVSLHAAGLAFGLLALNYACQNISPMQVTLMFNLGSVVNVFLQYTILSGHLYGRKNALEVVGCLLIAGSIMLSAISNHKSHEDFPT